MKDGLKIGCHQRKIFYKKILKKNTGSYLIIKEEETMKTRMMTIPLEPVLCTIMVNGKTIEQNNVV